MRLRRNIGTDGHNNTKTPNYTTKLLQSSVMQFTCFCNIYIDHGFVLLLDAFFSTLRLSHSTTTIYETTKKGGSSESQIETELYWATSRRRDENDEMLMKK